MYVLVQDAHAPPSRRHWNDVAPSEPTNAKVGVVSVLDAAGPEVIVVSGGVVSTVNPRLAGVASVFPCSSVARTSKVCAPSANAAVVVGELHADHAPPSTRHSNVAPASEVNENVGVLSPVVPLGPAVIVVSGAVGSDVSTVKDRLAGVGSGQTDAVGGADLEDVRTVGQCAGGERRAAGRERRRVDPALEGGAQPPLR